MDIKTPTVAKFSGLNNVVDPLRLGLKWLVRADNIDITGTGGITRRPGYAKITNDVLTGAYTTADRTRMYAVRSGSLIRFNRNMTSSVLRTGLSSTPMRWTEVNGSVYYANGVENGRIAMDESVSDWGWSEPGVPNLSIGTGTLSEGTYQVACTYILPDGRETGAGPAVSIYMLENQALTISAIPQIAGLTTRVYIAPANSTVFQLAFATVLTSERWDSSPDALGTDLTTQFCSPPPVTGTLPTFWRGRMYLTEYLPAYDITAIWFSEPLGFHLFMQSKNFISVSGKCVMLAPHEKGLIIGTDKAIFAYDGETLSDLADYGALPGHSWVRDDDTEDRQVLFWTTRGLCSAFPFSNLTRSQISVRCGISAATAIIQSDGTKKFVAALEKGGEVFNQRA